MTNQAKNRSETVTEIRQRRHEPAKLDRGPNVTVHFAQTLDGRIATRTGQSQWISGDEPLAFAHQLRAMHDAVMVGAGTIRRDNPRLTVRRVSGISPVRVIVASRLRIPPDSHVISDGDARTIVATTRGAETEEVETLRNRGIEVLEVLSGEGGLVDLEHLLRELQALGMESVLVEGGATLITSLLRNQLVNRLTVCIAPKIVGSGIEAVGNLDIVNMQEALKFTRSTFTNVGGDIIFDGHLTSKPALRV